MNGIKLGQVSSVNNQSLSIYPFVIIRRSCNSWNHNYPTFHHLFFTWKIWGGMFFFAHSHLWMILSSLAGENWGPNSKLIIHLILIRWWVSCTGKVAVLEETRGLHAPCKGIFLGGLPDEKYSSAWSQSFVLYRIARQKNLALFQTGANPKIVELLLKENSTTCLKHLYFILCSYNVK